MMTAMKCLTACILLATLSAMAASDVPIPVDMGHQSIPKWSHGALILPINTLTTLPIFHLMDRNGVMLPPVMFSIPNASTMTIIDYDRAANGTMALSGGVTEAALPGYSSIAWVRPDGSTNIVRTAQGQARQVALAPDGSLWTQGRDLKHPKATVLTHFDQAAKVLGSYVLQNIPFTAEFFTLRASAQGVPGIQRMTKGWWRSPLTGA